MSGNDGADDKARVDIQPLQVAASALAAVSSAVLLSTIGVAGTIIGAAVGSVIATVGSAVYAYSLRVSKERVAAAAQVAAMARVRRVGEHGTTQQLPTHELPAEDRTGQVVDHGAARPHWREALDHLPWGKVLLATAAVFLVAMVAISGFELVAGKPLSRVTGGTSSSSNRGSTLNFDGSHSPAAPPSRRPTPSSSPTANPTSPATSSTPSASTSPSPTAVPTASDGTATPSPSVSVSAPTSTATGTPRATATASARQGDTPAAEATHLP
jgi:hypothetical protein